jgi:sugar lactone lactonase YvrE
MISKAKYWVAAGVIAGVVLGLFVIWYATDRANSHYGPSKIRVADQGDIWILSDGKLHVFDRLGSEQRTLRFADWKRASLQSDFYPLSGGDVLLAEPETHEVYRCAPGGGCTPLLASSRATAGKTTNAMMLAVDESRQRLYVADNAGHRLLLFDLEGKLLDDSGPGKSRFWFPNHIALSDGELLVTDTNHRRIVRLPVSNDRFGQETWTLPTAGAKVRSKRKWPMSFVALPDGQWWVAIAQEGMRHADVATFDAQGQPLGHVPLENNADPVSMVSVDDRMLIADTEHFRIRQVDARGSPLPDFGPEAFRQDLAALDREAGRWRGVRLAAQAAVILLPVLAILILWRMGERPVSAAATLSFQVPPTPIRDGETVWLRPAPRFVKQQTWLLRAYIVVLILLGAWGIWLVPQFAAFPAPVSKLFALVLALALVPAALLVIPMRRLLRSRLGTNGVQLFHDKGDGVVHAFPLAQTLSDGLRLLAGQRLIVMRVGPRMIYDRDDLQQLILARLGPAAQLSPWGLYLAGLRIGNRVMWWNTIAIALISLVWIAARLTGFSLKPFLTQLLK